MKKTSFSLVFVLSAMLSMANVALPRIFGDNMVFQRNKPISIWGWASPGEKLTVQFNKQTKTTKTNKSGKWQLYLDAEVAGGPYNLVVKGKNQVILQNILVGEVWVCSGQSNMEMPIAGWGKIDRYQEEIALADFPLIRHFKIPNTISTTLKEDITGGQWDVCSPANCR